MLRINAYAKINLFLDVLNLRPDGYHDIRTIMQNISLCDELRLNPMCFESAVAYDEFPGKDKEDDLVFKALELVKTRHEQCDKVLIDVHKRIPVAAGLGGGSADAAGAIAGLNRLFKLSLTDATMKDLGEQLGADVPFFLKGGTCVAEGIGSDLKKLPDMRRCYVIVLDPGIEVSTRWAYDALDAVKNRAEQKEHEDISVMLRAIENSDYGTICASMYNAFESVVFAKHPDLGRLKDAAREAGADASMMTGSGPAVFALASTKDQADEVKGRLEGRTKNIHMSETCQTGLKIVE